MSLNTSLLEGEKVRLGAVDPEKDAAVESSWTHEKEYMLAVAPDFPRPLSASQMKKRYENLEKRMSESGDAVYFAIRSLEDHHLMGFVHFPWIGWSNGFGVLQMALAEAERNRGFELEVIRLALSYAFEELNLFRVTVWLPETSRQAIQFFSQAGFQEEARRREALLQAGHRVDQLVLGLLQSEWQAAQAGGSND